MISLDFLRMPSYQPDIRPIRLQRSHIQAISSPSLNRPRAGGALESCLLRAARPCRAPPDGRELPALKVLRTRALNYLAGLTLLELNEARAQARIAAAEQNGDKFRDAQEKCDDLLRDAVYGI